METSHAIELAAQWLRDADGLLITAGAGMGVDSGLPDFRGTAGFWRAYPALGTAGIRFEEIASPQNFRNDPELAWAFYGHRLDLYRRTQPHRGFDILRGWAAKMPSGAFVFTSNVDGHFQKAAFSEDRVAECHGSIHWLQCVDECTQRTWPADDVFPVVDDRKFRLVSPLPTCPSCGAVARPNILMFNDSHWIENRTNQQIQHLENWIAQCQNLVAVEVGAGRAIPTVRRFGEHYARRLIRINPREFKVSEDRGVGIAAGALDALEKIERLMQPPREN
ncbi:SIR2 family NAD-dependent protein deacylase [Paraburkholderia metrosideri]|uniref:protein acetyllysine N-acetyltransferase n=1 Tax=Paraburkholderia metrosideri TaxID=580937 RepID=A0ABN7HFV5_9BURK|nr:Sir2 family NAD-dependent protein deacetylase [Paraburkholderia metrosideri]CAD6516394.1 NAD-dependent protein deacylase sirtuin-5, mitochondrial [Paraburkholderia metrosideri]